ncbi:PAS domain S-box protein [Halonotius terrestris]|uniref:histidine kinase n=1 Tax=Halonotius terrestris TaxID=2487750 RepID=A0A8J8PD14_9EURY|nr:PAS domain S-box protein [Halonotius terrestris]TQQ82957.1 PAS domain S-box protein [Halonotius terrestris]
MSSDTGSGPAATDSDGDRYRAIVEGITDLITVIDPDGTLTYVSPSANRLLGYEPAAVTGDRVFEYIHEADHEQVRAAIEAVSAAPDSSRQIELRFERDNGSWCWIEATLRNLVDTEPVGGILIVSRDITDRKEREQRIRDLKQRLELAVEGGKFGVWDWNMATDDVEFNERWATMLGYTPEEIGGTFAEWEERVHPEDIDRTAEALEAHIEGEADYYDSAFRMETADGDWKWIRTIGEIFERDESGEPTRAVGIHLDIDERKTYERRLKRQRNNLEVLNQVVRHDIRNDIQLVLAYVERAQQYVSPEGTQFMTQAIDAANDAIGRTETARDITEIMLQSETERQPISLRYVLETEIDDSRSRHEHALFHVDGAIPEVEVLADEMLEAVFRNLLSNAVQHNDKDVPEVTVSVTDEGGQVAVRIADNGPGIIDEHKAEIFDEGEMSLETGGTGLGLYLVEALVDRYGGEISVADNDPTGAVFTVRLPKAE